MEVITNLDRLCVHTITTRPWNIEEAAAAFSSRGIKGITVWRDALLNRNIPGVRQLLSDHDLEIVSLCRGGFFPNISKSKRETAIAENKRVIDEAHELGTDLVVLVCGADTSQGLNESRKQIGDGISALVNHAEAAGVKLAIEPLHPMYADTRSAINTLAQANDIVDLLNSPQVGVAVDVYHVWWDPALESELRRCGRNGSLFAYHICDWKSPTTDLLNDRGIMGEGCIPLKQIRSWVEAAGFSGFHEVEIFSAEYWAGDQSPYLDKIISSYKKFA